MFMHQPYAIDPDVPEGRDVHRALGNTSPASTALPRGAARMKMPPAHVRAAAVLALLSAVLTACADAPAVDRSEEMLIDHEVAQLTVDYNRAHATRYPVPLVRLRDFPNQPSTVGAADYSRWTIVLNPLWLRRDLCTVYKEAIAHELAHLFVDYDDYGQPRTVLVNTRHGMQFLTLNGPPLLQDSATEHGLAWQEKARALGADPCKEGYCYDPHPYRRFPPTCPDLEHQLAVYGGDSTTDATHIGGST